jgi:type IV pilus assembly protein PilC
MDFKYQARDQKGNKQEGIIRTVNEEAAVRELQKQGLYVVSVNSIEKKSIWKKDIVWQGRVAVRDVAAFARQFSVMIQSNIPIVSALQALARQTDKDSFRTIILNISARVEEGMSLSRALSEYPKIFNYFFISVIQSGEASGRMGDSLNYLADHLEREYKLRSQIRGAMIYPAFVLFVTVIAFVILTVVVIPNLLKALEQFDQALPTATRFVLGISSFMAGWGGLVVLAVLILAVIVLIRWFKTEKGRVVFDRWVLHLPLGLGLFFQKFYLTRFAQNLSVLVEAGLPISDALKITSDIVGNEVYRDALEKVQARVVRGERISGTLKAYPDIFHPFVVQMIEVGEQTGQVGTILGKIVDFYQEDISRTIDGLASVIEPVLILILGGMVGFLVLAVFLPIFTVQMAALGG